MMLSLQENGFSHLNYFQKHRRKSWDISPDKKKKKKKPVAFIWETGYEMRYEKVVLFFLILKKVHQNKDWNSKISACIYGVQTLCAEGSQLYQLQAQGVQ